MDEHVIHSPVTQARRHARTHASTTPYREVLDLAPFRFSFQYLPDLETTFGRKIGAE
jgi:hypothetical protein